MLVRWPVEDATGVKEVEVVQLFAVDGGARCPGYGAQGLEAVIDVLEQRVGIRVADGVEKVMEGEGLDGLVRPQALDVLWQDDVAFLGCQVLDEVGYVFEDD